MADDDNPTKDMVAAAEQQIRRANEGNTLAARWILEQATVALRDVLSGHLPDSERREYLQFLLHALDQIASGVGPEKALGLWTASRPHTVSEDRDFRLFVAIGLTLDKIRGSQSGADNPVTLAINAVSRDLKVGVDAARKAWNSLGGEEHWHAGMQDAVDSEITPRS